jgi:(4-alkanoyl-5-oxo-2,5-dihydrofuran-3-yl)methyl phosphate reductase
LGPALQLIFWNAARGVDVLFLVNSGPELARRDETAAHVAKAVGVKRLVKLSSMDAQQLNVGTGAWHAKGEMAIRNSGIPYTFVQPSGFMSNALFWAPLIKAKGVVRSYTGEGKIPFIHPDDIGAVAAEAVVSEKYAGASLPISGPEALSYGEMAAKIASATGQPIRFEDISEEEERRIMAGWGESAEMLEAHISIYQAIRNGRLATVTDKVALVLGRKPITFDQWVQENAPAFC